MLIYTSTISPRLQYITDFIGKEITGRSISLTTDKEEFAGYEKTKINYSDTRITEKECWIKPHTLLFETSIAPQTIRCFVVNDHKAFFKTTGDLPFDIFAASFYLLSRYEEYLPYTPDEYGRYPHKESLAFREGFLDQPLVNQWLQFFREQLIQQHSLPISPLPSFTFLPTYDIDIAWSYKNKPVWKKAGGLLRSLITGRWSELKGRINVLNNRQKDPFDSYGWLNQLHEKYQLRPYYFFLVAGKKGRYDKNISLQQEAMQQLVHDHAIRYPVGLHPSWRSGDEVVLLQTERDALAAVTGSAITASRQHYIRFTLPATFRRLITANLLFDFSMGYGSINGFRASVATPYYWYDLAAEKSTTLLLFPFCYMEANSFYEQDHSPAQALAEMQQLYQRVKAVNGTFIMIWHNHFLGTADSFAGWKEVYEQFIRASANRQ